MTNQSREPIATTTATTVPSQHKPLPPLKLMAPSPIVANSKPANGVRKVPITIIEDNDSPLSDVDVFTKEDEAYLEKFLGIDKMLEETEHDYNRLFKNGGN